MGTAQENSNDYMNSRIHCERCNSEINSVNTYSIKLRHGPRKGSIVRNCRVCAANDARKRREA